MSVPKEGQAEPIDLAAHLQLLGESLCTVGACLRVQVTRNCCPVFLHQQEVVDFCEKVGKNKDETI